MKHFALLSLLTITLAACSQMSPSKDTAVQQKSAMTCAERCASGKKSSGKQHCSHVDKTAHQQCHRHGHHGHHSQSRYSQSGTVASSSVHQIYQQYIDVPTAGAKGTSEHAQCQQSYDADGKQKPCCEHHAKAQCHRDTESEGAGNGKAAAHQCCTHGG